MESGCVQCTTEASSHQLRSLGIARRCAPESMNDFIEGSSIQAVSVQNAPDASRVVVTRMFPGERLACRKLRPVYQKNGGMKRAERRCNRVTETSGINSHFNRYKFLARSRVEPNRQFF